MAGRFFAAAAFLALPAFGASAQEPVPEPTIMIVEFRTGVPVIGLPRVCPGASPEEAEEGPGICLAELYQGRARVVRHISGPRVPHGQFVRLTAHARRFPPGQHMLVAAVPFRDGEVSGQFAWFWRLPERYRSFCMAADIVQEWDQGPLRVAFEAGTRRRFRASGYRERVDLRCIE